MIFDSKSNAWVEDVIDLEAEYEKLIGLIKQGDTKGIAEMFNVDESDIGDLDALRVAF